MIKFTITLTPPLVITADGDFSKEVFHGEFPFNTHRSLIIGSQHQIDKDRAKKLKRSSDMVRTRWP